MIKNTKAIRSTLKDYFLYTIDSLRPQKWFVFHTSVCRIHKCNNEDCAILAIPVPMTAQPAGTGCLLL